MVIGTGKLDRLKHERLTRRFGTVYLFSEFGSENEHIPLNKVKEGTYGSLVVTILKSEYLATRANVGLDPKHKEYVQAGEEIVLGTGIVFYETYDVGREMIGLRPRDNRSDGWLNPDAVDRARLHTVTLEFREEQQH